MLDPTSHRGGIKKRKTIDLIVTACYKAKSPYKRTVLSNHLYGPFDHARFTIHKEEKINNVIIIIRVYEIRKTYRDKVEYFNGTI